jgi:hypothetical protein
MRERDMACNAETDPAAARLSREEGREHFAGIVGRQSAPVVVDLECNFRGGLMTADFDARRARPIDGFVYRFVWPAIALRYE